MRFHAITRRVGFGRRTGFLFECRICGTTAGSDMDDCPTCGSSEIARYEL